MQKRYVIRLLMFLWLALCVGDMAEARAILRENMLRAEVGDYIVAAQDKLYTMLIVRAKASSTITIEELIIPIQRIPRHFSAWRDWYREKAQGHTCWVRYSIDIPTGRIVDYYSLTQRASCLPPQADTLLAKLLALDFGLVPPGERKKVGPQPSLATFDPRPIWNPPLFADGKRLEGVSFNAWRARWPCDGSDLSQRVIEVYLPDNHDAFPSYFPYWVEIPGVIAKARIRIVDSGKKL